MNNALTNVIQIKARPKGMETISQYKRRKGDAKERHNDTRR